MRIIGRRCLFLRRYFRFRFGFRTFMVSLAAIYFTATYMFHSGLNGPPSPPLHDPRPVKRWEAGGSDDDLRLQQHQELHRRRTPAVDQFDLQAAFDNIRQQERQRGRTDVVHEERLDVPPDVNVPASCNSSSVERRSRGDDFIPLSGAFLLSAYWDERPNDFDNLHNGTLIRIMSVLRDTTRSVDLVCDFGRSGRTALTVYEMCENHHRPYGSFILSCHVPDDVVEAPCFVTIVAVSKSSDKRVDVLVRTLRPQLPLSRSFSVCVPPLFGDLPPDRLVEFFELTLVLGADHIVIYDWKTSPATQRLVRHYAARCRRLRRCTIDVISWRLPDNVGAGIWYNGQSLAIQDCLYRQMAASRYVVFNDIDEFLVPRGNHVTNWTDLVTTLDRPLSCGFQFPSAFFDPSAVPATSSPVDGRLSPKPDLMTMRSTRRSLRYSTVRTKCMVRPYDIFEAGIHHVSKPIWAHLAVDRVDTELAILHHYRKCVPLYGMNCDGTVEDLTITRYFDHVARAVADVWSELPKVL